LLSNTLWGNMIYLWWPFHLVWSSVTWWSCDQSWRCSLRSSWGSFPTPLN
jgi:hypothetical protein